MIGDPLHLVKDQSRKSIGGMPLLRSRCASIIAWLLLKLKAGSQYY